MSVGETTGSRDDLPTFDLAYLFDDPEQPEQVTVYAPEAADLSASWISADADDVVPLERVA